MKTKALSNSRIASLFDGAFATEMADTPFAVLTVDGEQRYLPVDAEKRAVFLALDRVKKTLLDATHA